MNEPREKGEKKKKSQTQQQQQQKKLMAFPSTGMFAPSHRY